MSQPTRIPCRDIDDVPSPASIEAMADGRSHVVLEFACGDPTGPASFDAGTVVRRLAAALPEHFSVFDAGGRPGTPGTRCVTIMRVISAARVVEHEAAILAAARAFRATATALMYRLAVHLDRSIDAFADPLVRFDLGDGDSGVLDGGWAYSLHGTECRFTNRASGQDVEVRLGFATEFGVLDPYFFHRFVRTTPEFAAVAALFADSFHDPRRALEVLERRGTLDGLSSGLAGHGPVARR